MENNLLSLIVIRAPDIVGALEFYGSLGLDFTKEQHGSGPIHYSCELGDLVLEIYPEKANSSCSEKTTMLGFRVASLDDTLEQLEKLGIKPKSAPKEADWGRWSNVTAPDGRTIQLSEAPKQVSTEF